MHPFTLSSVVNDVETFVAPGAQTTLHGNMTHDGNNVCFQMSGDAHAHGEAVQEQMRLNDPSFNLLDGHCPVQGEAIKTFSSVNGPMNYSMFMI